MILNSGSILCICVIYYWIFWMLYDFALCILGLWYKHLGIHTFKIFRINVAYHYIILLWLDYIQESGINERLFTSCMINKNFFLSPINKVNFSLKTVSFSVNFTFSVFFCLSLFTYFPFFHLSPPLYLDFCLFFINFNLVITGIIKSSVIW